MHLNAHWDPIGWILVRALGVPEHAAWFSKAGVSYDSRILDIGCGWGRLLRILQSEGYNSLRGVDPFLAKPIELGELRIGNCQIEELEGVYGFIMLHHFFEHIWDPHAVLRSLGRLLAPGGTILIRIPVMGKWAWKNFGEHWVQIDAPRHFYLHTEKSLNGLAAAHGFKIDDVVYDSTSFQVVGSEMYRRGEPLMGTDGKMKGIPLGKKRQTDSGNYRALVDDLNETHEGDQACFYIKRYMCADLQSGA